MNTAVKTIPTTASDLESLVFENSDKLTALQYHLKLLNSLTTQINWLDQDMEGLEYKKDRELLICSFHEWRTNMNVISALITKVMKDTDETVKELGYLQVYFEQEVKLAKDTFTTS